MERRPDLSAFVDFHAVATHGSFSAASRATSTPKATLSRRIRALEEDLGVRLFERGDRLLRLTDDGEALRARTAPALAELVDASDDISGRAGRPRGRLRVNVPGLFAQRDFGAVLARFAAAYPEVLLDVVVQDSFVDPVADGFDVVVRVNPAPDCPLVGQLLYRDAFVVAAKPGVPPPGMSGTSVPAVVLAARPEGEDWTYDAGDGIVTVTPRPVMRLASIALIHDAALSGAGAAILPASIAEPEIAAGRLVRWGRLVGRSVEVWVLCPSKRLRGVKVTAFIDVLAQSYARSPSGRNEAPPVEARAPDD